MYNSFMSRYINNIIKKIIMNYRNDNIELIGKNLELEGQIIELKKVLVLCAKERDFYKKKLNEYIICFKNKSINDFVTNVFCFVPAFMGISQYKNFHMQHHRHLNTIKDPEIEYRKIFNFISKRLYFVCYTWLFILV